jgi:plasmid maintenance system killer protein
LIGREKEAWAFWINYAYRIKFLFLNDEEVLFLDIGTHEIYK